MADQPRIESLLRQAIAAHEAGDLSEAEALYRQVLEVEPTHEEALGRCIGIVCQFGRHLDVLPIVDAAASADPANANWPVGRAFVLTTLGRHADAVAAYDRAIALRPGESTFHYARAIALFSDDRDADALSALDTALALQPNDIEGHYARGETLVRLLRYDEALAAYDRAIEIQRDCAKALLAKAHILLLLGRYHEGLGVIRVTMVRFASFSTTKVVRATVVGRTTAPRTDATGSCRTRSGRCHSVLPVRAPGAPSGEGCSDRLAETVTSFRHPTRRTDRGMRLVEVASL